MVPIQHRQTMYSYAGIANTLQESLNLTVPPIAISLSNTAPKEVANFHGKVPAGCSFWEQAAKGEFTTSTSDHELCAIGVHTHALSEARESTASELAEALKVMDDLDYVREEEVAQIPVLQRPTKYVIYAPLADAPLPPDVVMLFVHSGQGLIITEAVHRVDAGTPPAMGRPACAVVPQVVNTQQAALSLGCCGARAYLDSLSDDIALWAFPGEKIESYAEQIASLAEANSTLSAFHQIRRKDIEAGQTPSIRESLGRL